MASPACSSDPASPALDAGGSAQDGAGGPADAGALLDAMAAADACLNTPGDCNHGMCSW